MNEVVVGHDREPRKVTKEEFELRKNPADLLDEWQKRLFLDSWYIKLEVNVQPEDMFLEGCAGCTRSGEVTEVAIIQIIDPHRYEGIIPFDFEVTLVHELLHLKLGLLDDDPESEKESLAYRLLHRYIDELARALVDAQRSK